MKKLALFLALVSAPLVSFAQVFVPVSAASVDSTNTPIHPLALAAMNDGNPFTGTRFGEAFFVFEDVVCARELTFYTMEPPQGDITLADGSLVPYTPVATGVVNSTTTNDFQNGTLAPHLNNNEYRINVAALDPTGEGILGLSIRFRLATSFRADAIDCTDDPDPVFDPICPSCEHTRGRLDRQGPGESFTDKLGNTTFIADERELRARTNWNYVDVASSQTAARDLISLAYYRGRDMAISHNGLWGLMGGVEAGEFDYASGASVTKAGLSIGAYAARAVGNQGVLDTSLTASYFMNKMSDTAGNSADVGSIRLQWNGGLTGTFGRDEGWLLKPSLNIALVHERFDAYTIGGTAVGGSTSEGGTASLDFDLSSPIRGQGRFTFGLGASQGLGTGFSAVGDVRANLSVGWEAVTMDKTVRKIELTAADIAGDITDYRLSGVWERAF